MIFRLTTFPEPSHAMPGIASHALLVCHALFHPPGIQSQCGVVSTSVLSVLKYSSDDHEGEPCIINITRRQYKCQYESYQK